MQFINEQNIEEGIKLICDVGFSSVISDEEPTQNDKVIEFVNTQLFNQYYRAVKSVVNAYKMSPLPNKFQYGQTIIVTNLPIEFKGIFCSLGDDILVDANTIANLWKRVPANFLYGHEIGHKIDKYIGTENMHRELARILDISYEYDKYQLLETFADECGNLVSDRICEHNILRQPLSPYKREGVRKLILSSIY